MPVEFRVLGSVHRRLGHPGRGRDLHVHLRCLTCPSVLTSVAKRVSKAHPIHVGALSGRVTGTRIRRVMRERVKAPAPEFPWPFGLPAFASWIILRPPQHQPSSRSAYQAVGLDRDGVSTFRTSKKRLGWAPPKPRDQRCPPSGVNWPEVASCLSAQGPKTAATTPSRGLGMTRHHREFTCVRPSSLPLACGSLMARVPLGLNAQLHTPPLPATHVSAGTGLGHWPEEQPISFPSCGCPHFSGATSCRTLPVPQRVLLSASEHSDRAAEV